MNGQMSRRDALKFGVLGAGALLLPYHITRGHGRQHHSAAGALSSSSGESPRRPPFQAELPIPPVIDATAGGTHQIRVHATTTQIIPGLTTPVWSYGGTVPGPTIKAKIGNPIKITFYNDLPPHGDPQHIIVTDPPETAHHRDSAIVVHAHGIHADAPDDGYPENTFGPGEKYTYNYPNNSYQQPATLWYHDHAVHVTGEQVYRGLKGFYIVTDAFEEAMPLPKGDYDVPLVIADALIDPSGLLIYDTESHHGVAGDVMTVNGRQQPRFAVANRKYRFRVLNGSDAREYRLALSNDQSFTVIGSDQGLLSAPMTVKSLRIAPAERYDIVIDFSRYALNTRIVLENRLPEPQDRGSGGTPELHLRQLMAFDVTRRASDDSNIPATLRPVERIPISQAVRTRDWVFDRQGGYWSINSKQWDPNRVDAFPRLNTTEIWRFINKSGGWTHPIHPHLVHYQILDINGRPPSKVEAGWKDTVWLGPNATIRVIMEFSNFTGRFAFHCHNAAHEDFDMMTQFEVV